MKSETEARAAILARVEPLPFSRVPLFDSLGRFSAAEVVAQRALPGFDNSAMDGYAVRSVDARLGARLRVIGEQPAGADRGLTIAAGEAVRIFTGAPLPAGADAVIMQEDVEREDDTIVPQSEAETGEFIRRAGADLAAGQKILERGDPILPQTLGVLASQGIAMLGVGGRPRVALVATGDELARLGETPRPGQIFESNSIMLQALVAATGAQAALLEHAPDELAPLTDILRRGLECDVLVISGGVSVGDRDLVKPALLALGVEIDLWRVAIKPGKPFLFGQSARCSVFGLPGNPVSAFVTFLQFVRPALCRMMGAGERHLGLRRLPARLVREVSNSGERPHYLRGELRDGIFEVVGRQESHALFGLSRSNALLRLAPGARLNAETLVQVEVWD